MNKRRIGDKYEKLVSDYLKKMGYYVKECNFRCKFGEVDIIAEKDQYLVFVEVKYRSTAKYGVPQEAVDYRKQKRISNVASCYLYKYHYPVNTPVRFDVAAVSGKSVELIENAFPYCGNFAF